MVKQSLFIDLPSKIQTKIQTIVTRKSYLLSMIGRVRRKSQRLSRSRLTGLRALDDERVRQTELPSYVVLHGRETRP